MVAAGANMALMVMVDGVEDHPDIQLEGMSRHEEVAKHLPGTDTIIIDVVSNFTPEGVDAIPSGVCSHPSTDWHARV